MISSLKKKLNFSKPSKIFVIGRNKTGTTSAGKAISLMGFKLGDQSKAELLIENWFNRDFKKIVSYCNTADAFQDVPFSLDYTYQILDYAFPNSKFILTVRNNEHEWYESLIRFHTQIINKNRIPTPDDLKEFNYQQKGWLWKQQQRIYGIDEQSLYNRKVYTNHYIDHNNRVIDYFKNRKKDLLILNIGHNDSMQHLSNFLKVKIADKMQMPHLNSSKRR